MTNCFFNLTKQQINLLIVVFYVEVCSFASFTVKKTKLFIFFYLSLFTRIYKKKKINSYQQTIRERIFIVYEKTFIALESI